LLVDSGVFKIANIPEHIPKILSSLFLGALTGNTSTILDSIITKDLWKDMSMMFTKIACINPFLYADKSDLKEQIAIGYEIIFLQTMDFFNPSNKTKSLLKEHIDTIINT
jgi:hypothetical protein